MTAGLAEVVNTGIAGILEVYGTLAAHRVASDATTRLTGERPLHYFLALCDFEPADRFLEPLAAGGLEIRIFARPQGSFHDRLRNWREKAAEAIEYFTLHPEAVGQQPIFVGHSAGGLVVYCLAALAKGGNHAALRDQLPAMPAVSDRELAALANHLQQGLFIAIGTPFHGVPLTALGATLNRYVLEAAVSDFVTELTPERLEPFYRSVGLYPYEVIDGLVLGSQAPWVRAEDCGDRVVTTLLQGGVRAFSVFINASRWGDGIVPYSAAILSGPKTVFLPFDHLSLVERPESAQALLTLIETLTASNFSPRPPIN